MDSAVFNEKDTDIVRGIERRHGDNERVRIANAMCAQIVITRDEVIRDNTPSPNARGVALVSVSSMRCQGRGAADVPHSCEDRT